MPQSKSKIRTPQPDGVKPASWEMPGPPPADLEREVIEEKREWRRLTHWIIRMVTLTFIGLAASVILTLCAAVLFKDGFEHELVSVFETFMHAIVEILKFLFSDGAE